jgi:hypothetical protein
VVINFQNEISESSYLMYHLIHSFFPDAEEIEITKNIFEGSFHFRVNGERKKYGIKIDRLDSIPHATKQGYFYFNVHLQNNYHERYPRVCKELVTYKTKRILIKKSTILKTCELDMLGEYFLW